MSRLAQQQQALLDALLMWPTVDATKRIAAYAYSTRGRGLKAYQTNGHSLAQRAMAAAYPVVKQLFGDESFGDLARALWHAHPPQCGDIAEWGEVLPAFLQTNTQLQDEPYLPDVARVEWALHCCARASDASADLSTVALLTTQDPHHLHLTLAPGCAVIRSQWPIASLVGAHLDHEPTLEVVGHMMRAGTPQDAVVWRQGLRPRVREAYSGEADFLDALLRAESLEDALDLANGFDFGQWLPTAAQSGLLLNVSDDTL